MLVYQVFKTIVGNQLVSTNLIISRIALVYDLGLCVSENNFIVSFLSRNLSSGLGLYTLP
jgi:hypothetical protein